MKKNFIFLLALLLVVTLPAGISNTVQAADVIYGVTMGRDSASQVISLKMDEVGDVVK